jgi:hypothetical protein
MEDFPIWFKACIYLIVGGTVLLVVAGVAGWLPG